MTLLLDFLILLGLCYVAGLAAYFGLGWALIWLNARNPHRRIQKERRGEDRARVEIRQSVIALLPISACIAGGLFAQQQGWTLFAPLELSWASAIGMFAVSVVLYDAWFYWVHRLMHWRPLYKHHHWHHRSVAPTVWSNYSDGLLDGTLQQSYFFFAVLVLPIPPLVLIAHRIYDHINGQIGHSGFEYFAGWSARAPWPMVCTTFHDQHHELFDFNYGNFFSLWDRLMGTLHPGYDAKIRGMEAGDLPSATRPPRGAPAQAGE